MSAYNPGVCFDGEEVTRDASHRIRHTVTLPNSTNVQPETNEGGPVVLSERDTYSVSSSNQAVNVTGNWDPNALITSNAYIRLTLKGDAVIERPGLDKKQYVSEDWFIDNTETFKYNPN